MADDNTPGGSPPANGTAADAAVTTTTTQQTAGSDEPLVNKREVVELRKETRENAKKLDAVLDFLKGSTPASKSEPVKADAKAPVDFEARFAAMERQLALKDAYADLGIKPGDARDLIESAIRGHNAQDPGEIRSLVEKYAGLIKPVVTAPATQATQTQVTAAVTQPKVPDGGPPSVDRKAHLPDDILAVPSAAWNAMSPAEQREFYENYKRRNGGGNPFAEKRGVPMIPKKG
jgi:hypothetical protein